MKEIILCVIVVVSIVFGMYLFFGLIDYVFSDPMNIINGPEIPPSTQIFPDFQLCRDKGGIPISSTWDGSLKRCDFKN